jgi:hypothetical protein
MMARRPHTLKLNEADRALLAGEIASHAYATLEAAVQEGAASPARLEEWRHLARRIEMLRVHRLRQKHANEPNLLHEQTPYKLRLFASELELLCGYLEMRHDDLAAFVLAHGHVETIEPLISETRRHRASLDKLLGRLRRMRAHNRTPVAA